MKSMYAFPLLALLSFNTFAGPIPNVQAPRELVDKNSEFAEGTMTQLSQQDVAQFIPWAQNAQTVLKKALKDSESMTVVDQVEYLKNIMQSVVRHSSQKKYQMFMRFALNRSLLLVQELLKEADVREVGVIENALDIELRGIELALSFFESDLSFQKRAQQGQDTVSMDYAKFGTRFGSTMLDAINSVLDASAQYRLLYKTLEMINWDLSRDPKALEYSDTIVEVYNMLKSLNEIPDRSDSKNISNVRRLNVVVGSIRELIKSNDLLPIKKHSKACGLEGSVEQRIQDCSSQADSQWEGFVLVARTNDLKEVHKQLNTGLLWGDRLPESMNHKKAMKACSSSLKEVAGISEVTWRLPTIEEYEQAERSGISHALPNMNYYYWSSSEHRNSSLDAWMFFGSNGATVDYSRNYDVSVRCVAR